MRGDLHGFLTRAGAVLAVAVLVLGLWGTWQAARRNGDLLEKALADLDHQRQVNATLLVRIKRQGERIRGQTIELRQLREALREAGIDPNRVLGGSETSTSTPAQSPPPVQPVASRRGRVGPAGPQGEPGPRGEPGPAGDPGADGDGNGNGGGTGGGERPRCRVIDPVTGGCVLQFDSPADPLLDPLTGEDTLL